MIPRVLGWLLVALGVVVAAIGLSRPYVSPVLFIGGLVVLVAGVAVAFGVFDALPDEQGVPLEEWRARHGWTREDRDA